MILVTGATGFIGSFICRILLEEGKPFKALKRSTSDTSLLQDIEKDIDWHDGDILVPDSLESLMAQIDIVIHSAALVSFSPKDFSLMNDVNIGGTRTIIDLSLKHGVKKLIHISSVAALGRNKTSDTIDETNKWQQSKLNTHYGETKYMAELEVWRGYEEGLDCVILNPSVVLGPGDWNRSSSKIFKYVWDERKFYTDGLINFVDVRDVSRIAVDFTESSISGERFIINAGKIPFKDLFEKIAERFGKRAPHIRATPVLVKLALFLEKLRSVVTQQPQLVTAENARVGKTKIYFDNAKVKSKLNYTFAPLGETLDWTCTQFLSNKK